MTGLLGPPRRRRPPEASGSSVADWPTNARPFPALTQAPARTGGVRRSLGLPVERHGEERRAETLLREGEGPGRIFQTNEPTGRSMERAVGFGRAPPRAAGPRCREVGRRRGSRDSQQLPVRGDLEAAERTGRRASSCRRPRPRGRSCSEDVLPRIVGGRYDERRPSGVQTSSEILPGPGPAWVTAFEPHQRPGRGPRLGFPTTASSLSFSSFPPLRSSGPSSPRPALPVRGPIEDMPVLLSVRARLRRRRRR